MKVTIAQLNPNTGDIEGNFNKAAGVLSKFGKKSDLVVFPELFLTGYPLENFLDKSEFLERLQSAMDKFIEISKEYSGTGILFGAPVPADDTGKKLYNSAVLIYQGKVLGVEHKTFLAEYEVFDETKYFDSSDGNEVIRFKDHILGISIGEDILNFSKLKLAQKGVSLFINIAAVPFSLNKINERHDLVRKYAKKYGVPFILVNQTGATGELVFDGRSVCFDKKGEAVSVFSDFEEHTEIIDISMPGKPRQYTPQEKTASLYKALTIGICDYINKNGFSKAVIGLSGGIDSAVTCVLAKEAIGEENVLGLVMPSQYSSPKSLEYSRILGENLGIQLKTVPISVIYDSYIETLKKDLIIDKKDKVDVYLQNIQARIRGNILMAFSNKLGHMVLATGNKSELLVGYCTLYGDMVGGFAVLADVFKTMVYELADYINRDSQIIPQEIITRVPSAELKPNQTDQDTLPPYDILDGILRHIEEGYSAEEIRKLGFNPEIVEWVKKAVNQNKYKRKQAPLGLKMTVY